MLGQPSIRPVKSALVALLALCVLLAVLAAVLGLVTLPFLVDWWWHQALGYGAYFWQRLLYRYAVVAGVTGVFFLGFALNFRYAFRQFAKPAPAVRGVARPWLRLLYLPLSLALAVGIALPLFHRWEEFLLFLFAPSTGVADPVFGLDTSFFLFTLPVFALVKNELLVAATILLAATAAVYAFARRTLAALGETLPRGAARHLGVLALGVGALAVLDLLVERYALVYLTRHEPLFSGPGYADLTVVAPLIVAEVVLLVAAIPAAVLAVRRRRGWWVAGGLIAAFLLVWATHRTGFLAAAVERYWVQPSQFEREEPFIRANIDATLDAYGLRRVDVREFHRARSPEIEPGRLGDFLRNVPVWNADQLGDVYRELQELRTYYGFPSVDAGRYPVGGHEQQVFLAARELLPEELPPSSQSWVNRHLLYTHGYGLVMTPASQAGEEPIVWFVRGLPLQSDYGFRVERPEVYFGLGTYRDYVVAPSALGELDYPTATGVESSHYAGTGGVRIGSYLDRILFAAYLRDTDLLLSTRLTDDSRILFRRNVVDRVRRLAPFLLLDSAPYLVVTEERLYWVLDAYTHSAHYPASHATQLAKTPLNYVRNSVKVVVDAYDGAVTFYRFDPEDPILAAYARIYPGLVRDRAEIPAALAPHLRYPRDLFETQMRVYAKYHQTDPKTFYQQEDTWQFARTLEGGGRTTLRPYFLTLDLIEPGELDFSLVQPMSPTARQNLRALMLVGCDPDHYGEIVAYSFPKGEIVYGPVQMEALINADPEISRQFTLWDLAKSDVVRGKMVILPEGRNVFYVQPVYLRATGPYRIPTLERVIMTDGQIAVMASSLEQAYSRLKQRVEGTMEKVQQRF